MLTVETIVYMTRLAGADFRWTATDDVRGGKGYRLSSLPRLGLRLWLAQQADYRCVFCGHPTPVFDPITGESIGELCHIVSRGPDKRGWLAGNIGWGCSGCNDWQALRGPVVEFVGIAHPERIPTEWPSIPTLTRMGMDYRANPIPC